MRYIAPAIALCVGLLIGACNDGSQDAHAEKIGPLGSLCLMLEFLSPLPGGAPDSEACAKYLAYAVDYTTSFDPFCKERGYPFGEEIEECAAEVRKDCRAR